MRQVVVAIAVNEEGKIACSTRTPDKDYYGKGFALPGGKVDEGETLRAAVYRECCEEGWDIYFPDSKPFFSLELGNDGEGNKFICYWFLGVNPHKLNEYKDKHRGIIPVFKSLEEVYTCGYHNNQALDALLKKYFHTPHQEGF